MSQPPPPPPGVSFSVGDAISYGWNAYWKNVGPMLLLALVVFAVNVAIGLLGQTTDDLVPLIILQVISFLVGIIFGMGLIRAALAVTEGRTPEVNMLFMTDGFGVYLVASILVVLGIVLGFVLLIVPGVILAIMWHFFGYVIVENPTSGPIDAMKRSAEITRGHRWQLFGLGLLLMLINIAGALACGVGIIFTYGITAIAVAYTYKVLSGEPVAPLQ
jgi:uncharacterized membrane protein